MNDFKRQVLKLLMCFVFLCAGSQMQGGLIAGEPAGAGGEIADTREEQTGRGGEMLEPYGLEILWGADLREEEKINVVKNFSYSGGRIILETYDAVLYILDAVTGRKLAGTGLKDVTTAPPLVSSDTVFVHTFRGLELIGASTGVKQRLMSVNAAIDVPPVSYKDSLIMGSASGTVFRLDLQDRSKRWTCSVYGPVKHKVILDTDRVVAASKRRLIVVDAEKGGLLASWIPGTGRSISSGPAVKDGFIYVGMSDRFLYSLEMPEDGGKLKVRWRFPAGSGVINSPVVLDESIMIFTVDDGLICVEPGPSGAALAWSHPDAAKYIGKGQNGLYLLTGDNSIVLVDPSDGREHWRLPLRENTLVAPYPELPGVFLASPDGVVFCLVEEDL